MGNFLSRKISEFLCVLKNTVNKRFILLTLFVGCYAVGLILGFVLQPTEFMYNYYCDNAQNYYSIVMFADSSAFSIFFNRIISNFGYYLIFFCLALVPALIPINIFIVIYRGFVAGYTIIIFNGLFGLTGVLISCFIILLQNLITTITLIIYSITPFKKMKLNVSSILIYGLILYFLSLLGAVFEVVILCLLLRPINFYF